MTDINAELAKAFFPGIPHVLEIRDNRVLLDQEYLQKLYNVSGRGGSQAVIKSAMREDGFDVDVKGVTLPTNIAQRFQRWGEPEGEDWFTFCKASAPLYLEVVQGTKMENSGHDGSVKEGLDKDTMDLAPEEVPDEPVQGVAPEPESPEDPLAEEDTSFPFPEKQAVSLPLTDEELLKTGKFIARRRGLGLLPELEEQVLSLFPGIRIEEALDKIGIPSASLGKERIKSIRRRILQMQKDRAKTPSSPVPVEQVETSSGTASGPEPRKDTSPLQGSMSDEELIATGVFIRSGNGIGLHPDYEKTIYASYPEKSIEESLLEAGLTASQVGKGRIYRLTYRFEGFAGKDPSLYIEGSHLGSYLKEVVEKYQDHPYVLRCTEKELLLSDWFMEDACWISSLPIKTILRVFCLESGLFNTAYQNQLEQQLRLREPRPSKEPSFEEITSCDSLKLQIMINREAALDYLIEEEILRIKDELPDMDQKQKRALFMDIQSFPRDPEGKYTTSWFLDRLSVSRSTFYAIMRNETYGDAALAKNEQDEKDAALIRKVMEYKGFRKGARQIYMMLPDLEGVTFALSKIRRLMEKFSLESGIRQPNPSRRQAKKYLEEAVAPNTLARRFRLFKPGQARLTDVTYLTYGETRERAYCSGIIDASTGFVQALNISRNNDIDLVLESLRLAKEYPCVEGGFIHSDQGCLYLSPEFRAEIERMGLARSMSRRGNAYDNATMESFNGTLKAEVDYAACRTFEELKALIESYRDYYNNERRRWDRNKMTPVQYESYLLSMTEEEWNAFLHKEEDRYSKMKLHSAEKAKENAKKCMGLDI